jgi:hypothetical protein
VRRLPPVAFGLLALATIGAFFLTQHLKVANPLVWNTLRLRPIPSAINPVSGRPCIARNGHTLDYRQTELTFQISHPDSVAVYIVTSGSRQPIATVSSGRDMTANRAAPSSFVWNGRLSDGRYAPDGTYYFRLVLHHQRRAINLTDAPVQVITQPPHPAIEATTDGEGVTVHFTRAAYRRVWIEVYRRHAVGRRKPGERELSKPRLSKPKLVARFAVDRTGDSATWNGEIDGRPAPAGIYEVRLTVQDAACNQASYLVATLPSA